MSADCIDKLIFFDKTIFAPRIERPVRALFLRRATRRRKKRVVKAGNGAQIYRKVAKNTYL
jgi:hypothetical protein